MAFAPRSFASTDGFQASEEPLGREVPRTYGYWDGTYGHLNDAGVAIGESTCSGVFAAQVHRLMSSSARKF